MAQGRFDLPFYLEVRETMDRMLSGSCWTPLVRFSHFSSVKDTNHLTTATCSPTCPSLVISLFSQTARLQRTAISLCQAFGNWARKVSPGMFYHEIFPDPVLNLAERSEEQRAAMLALQMELENVH